MSARHRASVGTDRMHRRCARCEVRVLFEQAMLNSRFDELCDAQQPVRWPELPID